MHPALHLGRKSLPDLIVTGFTTLSSLGHDGAKLNGEFGDSKIVHTLAARKHLMPTFANSHRSSTCQENQQEWHNAIYIQRPANVPAKYPGESFVQIKCIKFKFECHKLTSIIYVCSSSHYCILAYQDCNQCNVHHFCCDFLAAYHITPPLRTFVPEFPLIQTKEVNLNPWNCYLCPLLAYPASTFVSIRQEMENCFQVPTLPLLMGTRAT